MLLPGSRVHFNSDSLKTKLSTFGGRYDSIHVEISFAHRFGIMNKVGFVYLNSQKDYVFNDVDTHVVKAIFKGVENQNFFAFKNYDSSTSIYVNYIKVYGYRIDTIPNDTPTTGIKNPLVESVKVYSHEKIITVSNNASRYVNLFIYDSKGIVIMDRTLVIGIHELSIPLPGIYIVMVSDENSNRLFKKLLVR